MLDNTVTMTFNTVMNELKMSTFTSVTENLKKWWHDFDLKKWAEGIGGSSAQAVQAAVYFGLCFAIGFLFKKYFKFLFMSLIVSLFVIAFLHYNKLGVTVDFKVIKALLGIANDSKGAAAGGADMNVFINKFFDWIHDNMLIFISSIVGFFVGYKLG